MARRSLALSLIALGCSTQFDPCFDPDALVTEPRVLGVRVDPPEALADLAAGNVQAVQARVLAPVTGLADVASVGAQICAPLPDGSCPGAQLVREVMPLEEDATFPVFVPPALVQQAALTDPLHGFGGGIAVRLQLDVRAPGAKPIAAHKALLYALPDGASVNHGFEIVGVRVRRPTHAHHQLSSLPVPPDEQVLGPSDVLELDRYDGVWLRPILAPGPGADDAAEIYDTTDLSGRRVTLRESINYSFYSSAGEDFQLTALRTFYEPFFYPSSTGVEPQPGEDPDGVVGFVARSKGTAQGYIWIVARDSRGAQAWLKVNWVSFDATLLGDTVIELGHHCWGGQQ